jgi:hypothetical protein
LDFFGVMPDFSVRLIRPSDRVNSELEEIFQKDIREYQQLDSKDFYPDYTPKRGAENFKLGDFRLPAIMERGMILWHSRERLRPEDVRLRGVKALAAVEVGHTPPDNPNERGQQFVRRAAFKRLDKSRIIDQRVLRIVWSRDTFDRIDGPGMTVPEGLDALYEEGTLYFNNHQTASGFLDLTDAFDEASGPQIDDVMNQGVLLFAGEGTIHDFVNQTNKRAISMLWRSGRLSSIEVQDVMDKAAEYGIELQTGVSEGQERILVPDTNKGFKELLDLLNQDYFPGIFDGEHYVANSKRPV